MMWGSLESVTMVRLVSARLPLAKLVLALHVTGPSMACTVFLHDVYGCRHSLNVGIMRSIDVMIVGITRLCADTARTPLPLSVFLVLVCYPPNVGLSAPYKRALKIGAVDSDSGYTILCQFTELFDRISHIFHVKVDLGF